MNISLIVAAADNNAIGKNNQLMWSLPNDMKFFKNITWGMVVVMGRKTFESLANPLKGRKNIVIARQLNSNTNEVVWVESLDKALAVAEKMDVKELFVIGGGEIYQLAFPHAKRIYITRVHTSPPDADVFFPKINESEWQLMSEQNCKADEKHLYAYSFQLWEKYNK